MGEGTVFDAEGSGEVDGVRGGVGMSGIGKGKGFGDKEGGAALLGQGTDDVAVTIVIDGAGVEFVGNFGKGKVVVLDTHMITP